MSSIAIETARLIDLLPEDEKELAFKLIKRLVLAWDADYTKVTADEAKRIEEAENSGFVDSNEIDWEHLGVD